MRNLATLVFICLSAPAAAWVFTPLPVCTLGHDGALAVEVTYDPGAPVPYAISLTAPEPWPGGTPFGIRFEGPRGQTITTRDFLLSDGGRTLTVRDRGFGNVLDGLEFNVAATAFLGDTAHRLSLDGAPGPVRAFRDCISAPIA